MTDAQRLDLLRPLHTLGTLTPLGKLTQTCSHLTAAPIRRLPVKP